MYRSKLLMILACCIFCFGLVNGASAKVTDTDNIAGIDAGQLLQLIAKDKGKVVVVNVFASWCPPCREEVPGLVNVRRAFDEKKLTIVGISVDKEPKALANFMNEFTVNYPVRLATGDFVEKVGVTAVPQLLIYNKKGELVVNHRGLVDEADLKKAVTEILAE